MAVQFWVAFDGEERITINKALKGEQYECLECKGILIPKKGDIVSHHFAHKADFSCSGEGQKHLYVKELIYQILCMNKKLFPYADIKIEKQHLGLIPDVSIIWNSGEYIAIEVWDNGESTQKKKELYGKNMVEFNISKWGEEELGNPLFIINAIYPTLFQKMFEGRIALSENKIKKLNLEFKKLKKEYKKDEKRMKESYLTERERRMVELQEIKTEVGELAIEQMKVVEPQKFCHLKLSEQYCVGCNKTITVFHNFGMPEIEILSTLPKINCGYALRWSKKSNKYNWMNYCLHCGRGTIPNGFGKTTKVTL